MPPQSSHAAQFTNVARLDEIEEGHSLLVEVAATSVALFRQDGRVHAVDNRCPHMGFPLHLGSAQCGILTCHWHHARFDLASGGTFDPWADDVRAYPVLVEDDCIWIDISPPSASETERLSARLSEGMKRSISLIIAKSVVGLEQAGASETVALGVGAEFGTRYSRNGWGSGLTVLTAMGNILPRLAAEDRSRALYHGLVQVAGQTAGRAPAFPLNPLPAGDTDPSLLKQWFRQFVEMRDQEAAERVLMTALLNAEMGMAAVADMLFAAATDHVYLNGGHTLDFINKAFELLDLIGWEHAAQVLPSLIPELVGARRSEETSSWRYPIDLAQLLTNVGMELTDLMDSGNRLLGEWTGRSVLVEQLLTDDPVASVEALTTALRTGVTWEDVAGAVALAAARRIAQFRTSNEFGDWITVLHTFTYANAVHQAMKRAPSLELLRGVFAGALSVYLDRFLNMPPAPLPRGNPGNPRGDGALLDLLDRQQQVNEAAQCVADHLASGGSEEDLMALLGKALLREDAEFHTYQMVEAGFRQCSLLQDPEERRLIFIAMSRYLAAHSPTSRASGQTYQTAVRLHKGEALYSD